MADVPIFTIDGVDYRSFLLDINQTGESSLLSLDEIQVLQSSTPNQSVTTFSSGIVNLANRFLVYRLDNGGDNWIKLDNNLSAGSGKGDMSMFIPASFFTGSGQYVYLYSKFGVNIVNNDGFEEWSKGVGNDDNTGGENPIPEPGTMLLLGTGLAALVGTRRKLFA